MSWYNPIDAAKWAAGKISGIGSSAMGNDGATRAPGARYAYNPNSLVTGGARPQGGPSLSDQTGHADPWQIDEETRKRLLYQQGGIAGQFADQGQQGFANYGAQGTQALAGLQAIANGQNSVSAEQLRQGVQQNQAVQQSIAAGAAPRDAAGAARTAAIQSGLIGSGLAGQQAIAGLQERNQAQGAYAGLLQGLRGQDLNAALGARQTATGAYGSATPPERSSVEKYGPAAIAALSAMSDRRLKKDIREGDDHANRAIKGLRSYVFRYKDERHGKGDQPGVMAQDLERVGLKHAVIETPIGKAVHGAKLATANTGMIAALGRRVAELEGKGK